MTYEEYKANLSGYKGKIMSEKAFNKEKRDCARMEKALNKEGGLERLLELINAKS